MDGKCTRSLYSKKIRYSNVVIKREVLILKIALNTYGFFCWAVIEIGQKCRCFISSENDPLGFVLIADLSNAIQCMHNP